MIRMGSRARWAQSAAGVLAVLLAPQMAAGQPAPAPAPALDRTVLPIPNGPSAAVINETVQQSRPDLRPAVPAPAGAPNVLLVMTDDVGFGASSAFGGPVPTPNLERLAQRGLRYNELHTTAICSPSRAVLLTGRNHHAVGQGHLADTNNGFPGYNGNIPRSAATIARVLGDNGYSTAMFGKHHNVPVTEQSMAGPFDQWPTGLGFDYFYGFIGGDSDQYQPRLYRGVNPIEDRGEATDEMLDQRLADDAIRWLHNQKAAAPDKPFFVYLAPGTAHAPHQAPPDWIARFRGKFDKGWDWQREETLKRQKAMGIVPANTVLAPRPGPVPAWDSLSPEMKRVNARSMEVFAAQLAYQDAQFGRIVDELQRMGQLDNTLVIFIEGDNGGSAESGPRPTDNEIGAMTNGVQETDAQLTATLAEAGGPQTYSNYAVGWAEAMNTPFPWFKQIGSHLGGMRNGMVISWPEKIAARGQTRSSFSHLNDIMPTILQAAQIPAPTRVDGVEQQRIDGVSLTPTFTDPKADNHHTQYFEIGGNRAIYHDGWLASTTPTRMPWDNDMRPSAADTLPQWTELYDLRTDYSQSHNLAAKYPDKLRELAALWDAEARRNNVYPLDGRANTIRAPASQAVRPNATRTRFTYWGKDVSVMNGAAPSFAARSFSVSARIDVPPTGASGVVLATGSWFGGWSFYLKDGRPTALEAVSNLPGGQFQLAASDAIAPGPATVTWRFASDGGLHAGGTMTILVNDRPVASGRFPRTILTTAGLGETLDVGRDTGVPVAKDYGRGEFTGTIERVDVELAPMQVRPGPAQQPAAVSPD